MTKEVRVTVLVSHLRLGGHPFQEEEITYRRGQELDLPEDYAVRLGTSVSIHPHEPEQDKDPEPIPTIPEEPEEPEPEPEKLIDIQSLSTKGAKKIINDTDSPEILYEYLKEEEATRNRKTVVDAINAKLAA